MAKEIQDLRDIVEVRDPRVKDLEFKFAQSEEAIELLKNDLLKAQQKNQTLLAKNN